MMGHTRQRESKLFYTAFSLEQRIGKDNRYRRLTEVLDFSFIRPMVAKCYGQNGHASEDPIVIMKLMLILFLENIPSERELMRRLPERLDWLWFCEFDLDDTLPNHSVPSKARRRWGLEVFEEFFQVVLTQCMKAGLVDGETIHIDSSLIQGDVSVDSLQPAFAILAQQTFQRLEENCREPDNKTLDTGVTPSVESAPINTDSTPIHVAADKAYGTAENYEYLHEQQIAPCIPHKRHIATNTTAYPKSKFTYVAEKDYYVCPAGEILKRQSKNPNVRGQVIYRARGFCLPCLRPMQCLLRRQD